MREKKLLLLLATFILLEVSSFTDGAANKQSTCGKKEWRCNNHECIEDFRHCDGKEDCSDKSDEKNCHKKYCLKELYYYCTSGECIDKQQVCDGNLDCSDQSDEENCSSKVCPQNKFQCENGRCINRNLKCNGKDNCEDKSDEKNCNSLCPKGYAACNDKTCLPTYLFCNGEQDCPQREDEEHCNDIKTKNHCTFDHGLFLCKDSSKCIKINWLCDKNYHCNDHSDEGGSCDETCKESNLQCQNCTSTPDGPRCFCPKGYELGKDKTCLDVDECRSQIQVCDHICENKKGKYTCKCAADYNLDKDGATCRIYGTATLFFTTGKSVHYKLVDGSRASIIWQDEFETTGVAYDPQHDTVYWVSGGKKILFKSIRDMRPPEVFVDTGFEEAENLAIDWIGRNIYITDYKNNSITVCGLETASCLKIFKDLDGPRGLQLDLNEKYVYWTAVKAMKIERARLDGKYRTQIVDKGLSIPNGLAIDYAASRIYWADAGLDVLGSSDLNGVNVKSLPNEDASHVYSLAVWQDRIYWTEWQNGLRREIHSCRKRDGKYFKYEYKSGKEPVSNLVIYHRTLFKEATNPCNNIGLKCSDICLAKSDNEYTCACPEETLLGSDSHTCEETREMPLVFVKSKLYGILLRRYGKSKAQIKNFLKYESTISDMDYNPQTGEIIIADTKNDEISSIKISTPGQKKIVKNIKSPISVALDWLRGNLYWINGFHRTIEVSKLSGEYRLTVIQSLRTPTDIALDVQEGNIFVSDASLSPSITKCNLDGTSCKLLVHEDLQHPSSLSLDLNTTPKRIYWTDRQKGTIESAELSGANRKLEFVKIKKPEKLYISNHSILWTKMRSTQLYIASKHEDHFDTINIETISSPDEWFMALTMTSKDQTYNIKNPCTNCEQFCFSKEKRKICGCSQGLKLGRDGSSCQKEECSQYQKKCDDGECVPAINWCDGPKDCSDGSDEKNCTRRKCLPEEFTCKDGQCIILEFKCNKKSNCFDNSDEDPSLCKLNCTNGNEWQCKSGECIPLELRCDFRVDCYDGSDERLCHEIPCKFNERRCNDGHCINQKLWCDGDRDCINGEDEKDCPCQLGEYKCKDGTCLDERKLCRNEISCGPEKLNLTCDLELQERLEKKRLLGICQKNDIICNTELKCIPLEAWCNKTKECSDGSDEENCVRDCKEDEVKCKEEEICIPKSWRCDGNEDCIGGSDEKGCGELLMSAALGSSTKVAQNYLQETNKKECSEDKFTCPDGTCLEESYLCDNNDDCTSGADESATCGECNKNKGGCDHFCKKHPVKPICSCETGYRLSSNGYSCEDINECDENKNICEHNCENKMGTFICTCQEGYTIMRNGFTCKPKDGKKWLVALIQKNYLYYLNDILESKITEGKHLPPELDQMVYDPLTEKLIGINKEQGILYRNLPGVYKAEKLFVKNILTTSLDFINRNLYIAKPMIYKSSFDKNIGTLIKVYNLGNKVIGTLFTVHGKTVVSMKLLLQLREIITCENEKGKGSIYLRNMDGTNEKELVYNKIRKCESVAVDEIKQRVYWIDSLLDRIESVDLLGHDRKRFVSNKVNNAVGLAVLNRALLWFNSRQQVLVKCQINSTNECIEMYYKLPLFNVISPVSNLNIHMPCENSTCDDNQICVPHNFDMPECVCVEGSRKENKTCILDNRFKGKCIDQPCSQGKCIPVSPSFVECKCPDNYGGKYCEIKPKSGNSWVVALIVIILFLLALAIGVFFFCKKNSYSCKKSPFIDFKFVRSKFELMKEEEDSEPPTPKSSRRNLQESA